MHYKSVRSVGSGEGWERRHYNVKQRGICFALHPKLSMLKIEAK
jgi:hypothetical protein